MKKNKENPTFKIIQNSPYILSERKKSTLCRVAKVIGREKNQPKMKKYRKRTQS